MDHTLPQTTTATTTQAQERSARSRSAERDRLPAGTTATPPESTRGAGRAASGTAQPSADATAGAPAYSRSKSGAGAKGRCRHHLPTSGQRIGELAFCRATAGLENLKMSGNFTAVGKMTVKNLAEENVLSVKICPLPTSVVSYINI